jgi:hypothetical protein
MSVLHTSTVLLSTLVASPVPQPATRLYTKPPPAQEEAVKERMRRRKKGQRAKELVAKEAAVAEEEEEEENEEEEVAVSAHLRRPKPRKEDATKTPPDHPQHEHSQQHGDATDKGDGATQGDDAGESSGQSLSDEIKLSLVESLKAKLVAIEEMVADNVTSSTTATTTSSSSSSSDSASSSDQSDASPMISGSTFMSGFLGIGALFCGATAARALRRRGALRACIENERYDDFNYDDDIQSLASADLADPLFGGDEGYGTCANDYGAAAEPNNFIFNHMNPHVFSRQDRNSGLQRFDV